MTHLLNFKNVAELYEKFPTHQSLSLGPNGIPGRYSSSIRRKERGGEEVENKAPKLDGDQERNRSPWCQPGRWLLARVLHRISKRGEKRVSLEVLDFANKANKNDLRREFYPKEKEKPERIKRKKKLRKLSGDPNETVGARSTWAIARAAAFRPFSFVEPQSQRVPARTYSLTKFRARRATLFGKQVA